MFRSSPEQGPREIPIYFEVVEAAALEAGDRQDDSLPDASPPDVPSADTAEPDPPPEPPPPEPLPPDPLPPDPLPPDPMPLDPLPEEALFDAAERRQEIADEPERPESAAAAESAEQMPQAPEERARVVSAPIALNRIAPVYPRSARRKGHEGSVTVEICIASDGRVTRVDVVGPSGYDELDAAAVAAVETARFAPATEDGVSISGELRLTFDFRLR